MKRLFICFPFRELPTAAVVISLVLVAFYVLNRNRTFDLVTVTNGKVIRGIAEFFLKCQKDVRIAIFAAFCRVKRQLRAVI